MSTRVRVEHVNLISKRVYQHTHKVEDPMADLTNEVLKILATREIKHGDRIQVIIGEQWEME